MNKEQQIDEFFNQYCDVFNRAIIGDNRAVEHTSDLFSESFIGANPLGVNCGKNDAQFREALLKGYAFYKSIGITSMEIVSKEISALDDFHTMIKVRWKSNFTKKNGPEGSIEFTNIYFTQFRENKHKVFAYITGDEQAALKQCGLI